MTLVVGFLLWFWFKFSFFSTITEWPFRLVKTNLYFRVLQGANCFSCTEWTRSPYLTKHAHCHVSVKTSDNNSGPTFLQKQNVLFVSKHPVFVLMIVMIKFVLFNDATGTHWFLSYHRLLDVIHMVTLTHFLEGNPLPPHKLLFSISSKGSFICTFP